jgi:hypothetical protein
VAQILLHTWPVFGARLPGVRVLLSAFLPHIVTVLKTGHSGAGG